MGKLSRGKREAREAALMAIAAKARTGQAGSVVISLPTTSQPVAKVVGKPQGDSLQRGYQVLVESVNAEHDRTINSACFSLGEEVKHVRLPSGRR